MPRATLRDGIKFASVSDARARALATEVLEMQSPLVNELSIPSGIVVLQFYMLGKTRRRSITITRSFADAAAAEYRREFIERDITSAVEPSQECNQPV